VIVLDTHAWIWLVADPDRLGSRARATLAAERSKGIAAISCWEISMLVAHGRIELDRDPVTWMEESFQAEDIELLPLTPAVAAASTQFESFHGDPADRLIVATALTRGATLVTVDEKITKAKLVKTVW